MRLRPPRPRPDYIWETLGENALRAAPVGTAEATSLEAQADRTRPPWQIGQGPFVMAMQPRGPAPTLRADSGSTNRHDHQSEALGFDDELPKAEAAEVREETDKVHGRKLLG